MENLKLFSWLKANRSIWITNLRVHTISSLCCWMRMYQNSLRLRSPNHWLMPMSPNYREFRPGCPWLQWLNSNVRHRSYQLLWPRRHVHFQVLRHRPTMYAVRHLCHERYEATMPNDKIELKLFIDFNKSFQIPSLPIQRPIQWLNHFLGLIHGTNMPRREQSILVLKQKIKINWIRFSQSTNPFNLLSSLYKSSGKISFVRRDAAVGTMQLHRILLRSPSMASVFASPTRANLAALYAKINWRLITIR